MRVLIIGNIANNGYLLAKYLRERGIETDVLCYDYYDIMSCPEWEEADFDEGWGRNDRPNWVNVDLHGYSRPDWFIQGPIREAVKCLSSTNKQSYIRKISLINQTKQLKPSNKYFGYIISRLIYSHAWTNWHPSEWRYAFRENPFRFIIFLPIRFFRCAERIFWRVSSLFVFQKQKRNLDNFCAAFSNNFGKPFLHRLKLKEFILSTKVEWENLFSKYDIVQGHATDGIYPLFYGKRPYIAFEHGTIRNIPFQNDFMGQACALTYKMADKVLITNCDNIIAAKKLNLKNYIFLPHPINEMGAIGDDEIVSSLRNDLCNELNCNYLVLHPARQHWEPKVRHPDWEKGNDIFIRGFANFTKESILKPALILVEWGQKVNETKKLLLELNIADRVKWVKPMPHRRMVKYIRACDIVADQFWLGAFGGITPKAMMCGRAVLLNFNEDIHKWAFPELPPVLNADTAESVSLLLKKHSMDIFFRKDIELKSREWYLKYHSSKVIMDRLIGVYNELICTK